MLRITVELVPFGQEKYAKNIGTMLVTNDGSGDGRFDSYVYVAKDDRGNQLEGTIEKHDRSMSVWNLIAKCLNKH